MNVFLKNFAKNADYYFLFKQNIIHLIFEKRNKKMIQLTSEVERLLNHCASNG